MSFWESLKEEILELLFGHHQLEAWRRERAQREECERVQRKHYDLYRAMLDK